MTTPTRTPKKRTRRSKGRNDISPQLTWPTEQHDTAPGTGKANDNTKNNNINSNNNDLTAIPGNGDGDEGGRTSA